MILFGTIVNAAAIFGGGLLGVLIKKGIPKSVEESVLKVNGLVVGIIGLNGVLSATLTADPATGAISSSGEMLLLISMVVGTLIGELCRLDDRLYGFGQWIERKANADGFAQGFISFSLISCIGAMAIVGALNEGLTGDSKTLLIKSVLDGSSAVIFGATMGIGVAFAAIPVLLYQGSLTLLSGVLSPLISPELLNMLCLVGYTIVICIGLNFLVNTKIKTANLLPALLIPVVYNVLMMLKTL